MMSFSLLPAVKDTLFLVGISNKFLPFLFCHGFRRIFDCSNYQNISEIVSKCPALKVYAIFWKFLETIFEISWLFKQPNIILKLSQNYKGWNLFEMPHQNNVFFTAEKKEIILGWWAFQTNFSPSYFVMALDTSQQFLLMIKS